MIFSVKSDIWALFPGMLLVVARVDNVNNTEPNPGLYHELVKTGENTRANWGYDDLKQHPFISAWRDNLRRIGVNPGDFPCAIESLCRQVLKGRQLPNINPVVNFYNMLSLRNVVPVGGWSVDADNEIQLRLTAADEPFTALGKTEPELVAAGEIAYAAENTLVTRHFVWRQAERAKITPETKNVFLIAEILPEVGREVAERVEQEFRTELEGGFNVRVTTAILTEGTSTWNA